MVHFKNLPGSAFIGMFVLSIISMVVAHPSYAYATELTFESTETATQIYEYDGDQKKSVGVTPFTLTRDSFNGKVFLAEKSGFVPAYMGLYENPKSKTAIRFTMKRLSDWLPEEMNTRIQNSSEDLVDQVYEAQSLIEDKKYKDALTLLDDLKTRFPHSVSIRILYANAVFLTGDSVKANQIYKSVLNDIPDSRKTLKEQITKMNARFKNERVPASETPKQGETQ